MKEKSNENIAVRSLRASMRFAAPLKKIIRLKEEPDTPPSQVLMSYLHLHH
jgi:hypothetical protein